MTLASPAPYASYTLDNGHHYNSGADRRIKPDPPPEDEAALRALGCETDFETETEELPAKSPKSESPNAAVSAQVHGKGRHMRSLISATAFAAATILASSAIAKDVNKATVLGLESGGLQGGTGCLYVTTDEGVFTLPFNTAPNTPQLAAVMNISTHPSVSFNLGAPNAGCLAAPTANTILLPSTP